jgi:probable O-glycosylation ligase (exosortase A-associated)
MRDYLFLAFVLGMLPLCLFRPYIGGLMWVWIGLMNPHRLTWGIARYSFRASEVIGVTTLIGLLVATERGKFPKARETILLICLIGWFTVTTMFALAPQEAWRKWDITAKVFLMTLVTLFLFQDRKKLMYLTATIALSVAFYGIKGGIWGILTGGQYMVLGPASSFIEDNNALAVAELLVIPLLILLLKESGNKWMKLLYLASIPLTLVSVVLSYSRGAFLGLIVLIILFIFHSKRKMLMALICLGAALLAVPFLPQQWTARMETIKTYEEDPSALGRINAWTFAYRLALDRPLLGGGFETFNKNLFEIYAPNPSLVANAHSIYFEVLGEHGFVGLGLFLGLIVSSLLSLRWIKIQSRDIPNLQWVQNYARMIHISLACYLVSGAFLQLAYFDLFYYLIAIIVLLKTIIKKELYENPISVTEKLKDKNPFVKL